MQITEADRAFVCYVRERDAMVRAWMGKANSYRPEDVPAVFEMPTNEERGRVELIEFFDKPLPYGQRYGAYLQRRPPSGTRPGFAITTWMGDDLATVTSLTRHARGGSYYAVGIDGRHYHGHHNGTGMHCTLRLCKHQPQKPSTEADPKWCCPECKGTNVQISLPTWYRETQGGTLELVETDAEADVQYWYCEDCEATDSDEPERAQ